VSFRYFKELSGVLQHGEDRPLNVDHPGGIFLIRAKRINRTILPGEGQRPLLKFDGFNLIMKNEKNSKFQSRSILSGERI
jgi:hypothetical protein